MITKEKKQKIIEDLLENIAKAKAIYLTAFSGLNVSKISQFRNNLRQINARARVVKKTLADLSFQKAGVDLKVKDKNDEDGQGKKGGQAGQVSNSIMLEFAFEDPIAVAKNIWQFSKQNNGLQILGALVDGKILNTEEVVQLAQIPSREALLGRLAASLVSPMRNFNYLLQGNTIKLVCALSAMQKK